MPVEFTDWLDWHDPVYRVQTGDGATAYHHDPDGGYGSPAQQVSSTRGAGNYQKAFGGPWPDDDPLCIFRSTISKGLEYVGDWTGTCPTSIGTFLGGSGGGISDGSAWEMHIEAHGLALFGQQAYGFGDVSGWQYVPWFVAAGYDPVMNDPDINDELLAFVAANLPPGDGWTYEFETNRPELIGLEYAPDEPVTNSNTGTIVWLENATGWFYAYDAGTDDWYWGGGDNPAGDETIVYSGGTAGWTPAPPAWVPNQDPSPFTCAFLPGTNADVITFTMAVDSLIDPTLATIGSPPADVFVGRIGQTLAFRALWQPPRFRYRRDVTTVVRQYPRDDSKGVSSAPRLYPPPKRHRLAGGYQ